MKKYLLIAVYLIGCFVSYPVSKSYMQSWDQSHTWTQGDRSFCIVMSAFSWANVFCVEILIAVNSEKPAKW
jgi:hypothetical protein